MIEKECSQSPNGKHSYHMVKSGMHPLYGCMYCFKTRPEITRCPHCGHTIEIPKGEYIELL